MIDERVNRIAHVLWAANTAPMLRMEFYCIKSTLCHCLGTEDGYDVQRIDHECWTCGGDGIFHAFDAVVADECWKCCGTGVYSSLFVELKRWTLGRHLFHEPTRRLSRIEAQPRNVNIRGKVQHASCSWSKSANVAIGRLFDRSYYWNCLGSLPDQRFGLALRQCEAICRWVFGKDWNRMYVNLPAAMTWLEETEVTMSP